MHRVSLALGCVLWAAATGLLVEDAIRSGHLTLAHGLMPVLTAGTVACAVMAHHRLASLRLPSAAGFLLLAVMGSLLTVYSTLGRTAEARDVKQANAESANRSLATRQQSLLDAQRLVRDAEGEVARECKSGFGRNCGGWTSTLASRQADKTRIEAELSTMHSVPVDAKADALVRISLLLGVTDEAWLRSLINALDPIMLPLWLELGSIVGFAAGFPHRAETRGTVDPEVGIDSEGCGTVEAPWSQEDALADLRSMTSRGIFMDQRFLAVRWGRSKSTLTRWIKEWEEDGLVSRSREGKSKTASAR